MSCPISDHHRQDTPIRAYHHAKPMGQDSGQDGGHGCHWSEELSKNCLQQKASAERGACRLRCRRTNVIEGYGDTLSNKDLGT